MVTFKGLLSGFNYLRSTVETLILINTTSFDLSPSEKSSLLSQIIKDTVSSLFTTSLKFLRESSPSRIEKVSSFLLNTLTDSLIPNIGVYKFRINPARESLTREKQVEEVNYGFGYFDYIESGENLMTWSLEGTTGTLVPVPGVEEILGFTDGRLSEGYIKFRELEEFYKSSREIVVYWLGDVYYGWSRSFTKSWQSDGPWALKFNLTLKLHPYAVRPIFFNNVIQTVFGVKIEEKGPQQFIRSVVLSELGKIEDTLKFSLPPLKLRG